MIKTLSMALIIVMLSAVSQAAFVLVDSFDGVTAAATSIALDGSSTARTGPAPVSAIWDSYSDGSGNVQLDLTGTDVAGSRCLRFMSNSTTATSSIGVGRGAAFNQTYGTIGNTVAGGMFFRFMLRSDAQEVRTYMGLHTLTGTTGSQPLDAAQIAAPASYIAAGFFASGAAGTTQPYDIKTIDGLTTLKTGLVRTTWYDVWIIADNSVDKFDLYIRTAVEGRGAAIPSLDPADLVAGNIPFGVATADPLVGGMFLNTTNPAMQSTRTYIDDVYWNPLITTPKATNPDPYYGETLVLREKILSWSAPTSLDPNIVLSSVRYDVYMDTAGDPNGAGDLISSNQAGTTFNPTPDMAYNTQYYWRADHRYQRNDTGSTVYVTRGSIWTFKTLPNSPVFTTQPVSQVRGTANGKTTATFTVAATNTTVWQWYKYVNGINDTLLSNGGDISGALTASLSIANVDAADEGQYYCKASNAEPSSTNSARAWLEYARKTGEWGFENNLNDSVGTNHGTVGADVTYNTTDPKIGTAALSCNGTTTYATLPTTALPKAGTELTIAFWAKNTTADPNLQATALYACTAAAPTNRLLNVNFYNTSTFINTAGFDISNTDGGTNYDHVPHAVNLPLNPWKFWVFTQNTETGMMRIYENGVLESQITTAFRKLYGAENLFLGSSKNATTQNNFFTGLIDDLKIYNYAVDSATVANLYLANMPAGTTICFQTIPGNSILAAYDLNHNCRVDMGDFALFAETWMECQIVPDCIARP
jgi:hypothetical protein